MDRNVREPAGAGRLERWVGRVFPPLGGAWSTILRYEHRARLVVGFAALGSGWFMPAPVGARAFLLAYVGGVYLPWSFLVTAISRRRPSGLTRLATLLGDLSVVFAVELAVPAVRYVALLGYVLIVANYANLGGRRAGFLVSGLAGGLAIVRELLSGAAPVPAFVLAMFGAVLLATSQLMEGSTQALREAAEKLRELDRMKSDFISTVSHELRTPLTTILGFTATLAERGDELSPEQRRDIALRTLAAAHELDGMIAQILDFSRVERPLPWVRLERWDVGQGLRDAVRRLEVVLSGHRVEVHAPPGLMAMADPEAVARVLDNLLSNAAKFSRPGSRIEVGAREEGEEVVVSVRDEGPGIPPGEREQIFERFYRADRSSRGTGIGLAIVKQFVGAQGGRVWVESEPGRGATFRFALRRAPGS